MCRHCLHVGFPGVVGCVNGSHITILKPTHNGETFFNRKKDYSINCMFVCNSQEEIFFYSIGSPGSYHDSRVFCRSGIQDLLDRLPSDRHLLGMKLLFPALSPCYTWPLCYHYHHTVGDSAYPQSMSLMKT